MNLEWSLLAIEDRDRIFDYIAQDDPEAAVRVDEGIEKQIEQLIHSPQAGRQGRITGTRELIIARTPYIAAYKIQGNTIRVLRVLHGARLWPDTF